MAETKKISVNFVYETKYIDGSDRDNGLVEWANKECVVRDEINVLDFLNCYAYPEMIYIYGEKFDPEDFYNIYDEQQDSDNEYYDEDEVSSDNLYDDINNEDIEEANKILSEAKNLKDNEKDIIDNNEPLKDINKSNEFKNDQGFFEPPKYSQKVDNNVEDVVKSIISQMKEENLNKAEEENLVPPTVKGIDFSEAMQNHQKMKSDNEIKDDSDKQMTKRINVDSEEETYENVKSVIDSIMNDSKKN